MEDWLAVWDAATEADRRAVLDTVATRVEAASTSGLERIVAPSTSVIAARRDGDSLVVATCSHYQTCLRDATAGIPVIESDYVYLQVEIDELAVANGIVQQSNVLLSQEIFNVEYEGTLGVDAGPDVGRIVEEFLRTYRALAHLRSKLFAEYKARYEEENESPQKSPEIRVLAVVPDGERVVVTCVATSRVFHSSNTRKDWAVQYLTIEEVVLERGVVVADRRPVSKLISIDEDDLLPFDEAGWTKQIVDAFIAEAKDWRVVWQASGEADQTAARVCAHSKSRSEYVAVRPEGASGWNCIDPEVVGARRAGTQLTATFAWTHWVDGGDGIIQTIVVHEVTVSAGTVVRDRRLASGTLTTNAPSGHDPLTEYRERMPGTRDLAAAVAHIGAKLDAICDTAPGNMEYVQVAPTIHVARHVREQGRLVARVVGWYRLGAREQVGSDRITRYITVDDVTVEAGIMTDTKSVLSTTGSMSEQESQTEVAAQLDAQHVSEVVTWARAQP